MDIPEDKAIVIFDGVCNFCDASVRFLMNRDPRGRFLFASNRSEAGSSLLRGFGIEPDSVESVYLVDRGRIWSKSGAALQIARRMPFPWRLGAVFVVIPRFLRDWVYDLIARNRYRWFGRAESCRLPLERERDRFLP